MAKILKEPEKKPLRIDERTVIMIPMDADPEEYKEKYLERLRTRVKKDDGGNIVRNKPQVGPSGADAPF